MPDPVFVVAELSGNHNGKLSNAIKLIRAAKKAGADAVKLQTYTADTITMNSRNDCFMIKKGPWKGHRLWDLYQEASTPWAWHPRLFREARKLGLICFSTPFDPTSVDFLESLNCPIYKIASFEVVDIPLLKRVAKTRKPVIMSTGMASLKEITLAVKTLRTGGCRKLTLLHTVSAYPAKPEDMHLRNIPDLARRFSCQAGLSDHSPGSTAAVAATALGAVLIEKHLTLRRADGGPDAGFSMEPAEFAEMVSAVRAAKVALSRDVAYGPGQADAGSVIFRKSLFAARDIPQGAVITAADVRCIRPGNGLPPALLPQIIGKRAQTAIERATPLRRRHFR